jgi:hypothetical protein
VTKEAPANRHRRRKNFCGDSEIPAADLDGKTVAGC